MVVFPVAKINIGLYVTDKRIDGYHNIETLFYPLSFSDILEVVPDPESGRGNIVLTVSGLAVEGAEDTNLVVRAYRLLHAQCDLPAVRVCLHKCIPTGAGLGGGSSDGAFMLKVLNDLFELNLSYCDLFSFALQLGSDCPFFLDPEPSIAYGRGELIKPSGVSLKGLYLMLFHPGTGISTASAYRHVKVGKPGIPVEEATGLPLPEWSGRIDNVFEPYAFVEQPAIRLIKDQLYQSGAIYASMTGSGSAVYGLFNKEPEIPKGISGSLIWQEKL